MATMHDYPTLLARAERCRYNLRIRSQPAMGKTYATHLYVEKRLAEDPDFFFGVMDGGTASPTDFVMSMPDMKEGIIRMLVSEMFPNAYATPDLHGIIYVGEEALMGMETHKGFQKMMNHEDFGGHHRIPDGVIFVADGNRLSDKSGGQALSRAMGSRAESHVMEYDPLYNQEVMKGYHPLIGAFALRPENIPSLDNYADIFENAERRPGDLFYEEGKEGIWANLRSWKRISDKLYDVDSTGIQLIEGEISRNVGSQVAPVFQAFQKMVGQLATLEEIQANPDKAAVPKRMDEMFALSSMLALLVNKTSFDAVATYMQRMADEIQVVFFRLMNDRLHKAKDGNSTAIRASKVYQKWITKPCIYKLITGTTEE